MSGELILVIDDSKEIIRHLTERLLPTFGFRSMHADNGREGLDLIRQERPDLVMIDLNLPELTGLDVLQRLAYESIEIPTILMTGYGSEKSAIEAFRLGVRDYLIKPFTVDEVLETINRALMEKRLLQDKQQLTVEIQRSNTEMRRRLNEVNNIIGIGKSIISLRQVDQVVAQVLESAIYITNAEECVLWLLEPGRKRLKVFSKLSEALEEVPNLDLSVDHPLITQVLRDGRILREASFSGPGIKIKTGYMARALLYVPLSLGGRTSGVLGVTNRSAPRAFSERDEGMLKTLADFAAISIENAIAFEESGRGTTGEASANSQALQNLSRASVTVLSLDELMRYAIAQVHEVWDIEASSIWLLIESRKSLRVLANVGIPASKMSEIEVPVGTGLVGHTAKSGKWIYTNDAKGHRLHFAEVDQQTGFRTRSILCVPLMYRRKVMGVLQLLNKKNEQFNHEDVELALRFGAAIAVALSNALLNQRAEKRKQLLDAFLNASPQPILVLDQENVITQFNRVAADRLGLEEGIVGQRLDDVVASDEMTKLLQSSNGGRIVQRTIQLENGSLWQAALSGIPDRGQLLFLQDISLLKQAEDAKSDFLETVSHDLRSPLASVTGFANALREFGELNEKQQVFVDQILESTERMTNLVNDLLDLARITTRIDQTRIPCDVVETVREIIYELEGLAMSNHVHLQLNAPQEVARVFADPRQLRQAVSNLVENAIKYTDPDTTVEIRVQQANGKVAVAVIDQGPGILPEDQPHIFDRFYRGRSQQTIEGTGLGLALVHSIANAHAGEVAVKNNSHQGATFIFSLPSVTSQARNHNPQPVFPPN
jgi:signal transduction histidine kinase/CheY-like chemotaxis protein